jgi:hypothetical protein
MAERKVNSVTTPSGIPVELKEYITAGEFLDATEGKEDIAKSELAQKMILLAVVSLNGSTENILATLRALPLSDYTFISKEVAKLANADFTQAKTSP